MVLVIPVERQRELEYVITLGWHISRAVNTGSGLALRADQTTEAIIAG